MAPISPLRPSLVTTESTRLSSAQSNVVPAASLVSPKPTTVTDTFDRTPLGAAPNRGHLARPIAEERLQLPTRLETGSGNDTVDIRMGDDQRVHVTVNGEEKWSGTRAQFERLTIDTGAGDDHVTNSVDGGHIVTGDGDDRVVNRASKTIIDTGAGNDQVVNEGSDNDISTDRGDDHVSSRGERNVIAGGRGNDVIGARGDGNRLSGGDGADQLASDGDQNRVDGGRGDDVVDLRGDDNTALGGDGVDTVRVDGDRNVVDGGAGLDRVSWRGNGNQRVDKWDVLAGMAAALRA